MADQNPYISHTVTRIKNKLKGGGGAEAFKETVKSAVNLGVDDFVKRIQTGQVRVETVSDFDRLVKLGLLVHGEPTEIIETQENSVEEHIEVVKDSPEFEAIKNLLAAKMNQANQEES